MSPISALFSCKTNNNADNTSDTYNASDISETFETSSDITVQDTQNNSVTDAVLKNSTTAGPATSATADTTEATVNPTTSAPVDTIATTATTESPTTSAPADITVETTVITTNAQSQVVNIQSQTDIDLNLFTTEAAAITANTKNNDVSGQTVTAAPVVKVHKYSQNTMYFIAGTCEPGAKIKVTGGTDEFVTGSDFGDFAVEIPFAETGTSTLKLSAIADGKLPSAETTFIIKPQKNVTLFEDGGLYGDVVGYNYQFFCEDSLASFEGDDVLKDSEIAALQTRTAKKIQDLRDKGCNAEIIYLVVPNPMRVYAENAPTRYTENTGVTLRQQWEGAVKSGRATVIDLTDLFMQHKNDDFKIFHKTDTHWSEYGAMLGYNALMSYIGQKFPDAAPRPASDFAPYNKDSNWGDMYATIGLSLTDLNETSAFVKFNFNPPGNHLDLYDGNSVRLVHARVQDAQTTHTNLTGDFPSVYIYRDSFAGPLHAFITDRFSTATFTAMWDYTWRLNDIVSKNPDYVLYIINERNIPAVLYN